jgi:hypothetical protein
LLRRGQTVLPEPAWRRRTVVLAEAEFSGVSTVRLKRGLRPAFLLREKTENLKQNVSHSGGEYVYSPAGPVVSATSMLRSSHATIPVPIGCSAVSVRLRYDRGPSLQLSF